MPSGFLRGYLQLKDDVSEDAEDSEEEAQNEEPTEESSDSDDEWINKTFIFQGGL